MTDDAEAGPESGRTGWGPWALVAGVGAVGVVALVRELRERRRDDGVRSDVGTGTGTDAEDAP